MSGQSSKNFWMSRWMKPSHSEAEEAHCSNPGNEDLENVRNDYVARTEPIKIFTMGESKSCEIANAKPVRSFNVGESESYQIPYAKPVSSFNMRDSTSYQIANAKPVSSFNMGDSKSCGITNLKPRERLGSSRNEGMSGSLLKDDGDIERAVHDRNLDSGKTSECKRGIQLPSTSRGCHSLNEGSLKMFPKLAKNHSALDRIFKSSKSLQELHTETSSHILPYNIDLEKRNLSKGKAVMSHFDGKTSQQVSKQDTALFEQCGQAELFHERNSNSHVSPGSKNDCYTDIGMYGDRYLSSTFGQNLFSRTRNSSGVGMSPSEPVASDEMERKMSYDGRHSQQKLQDCVYDMETTRFSTPLDSVQGLGTRFSQTTHRLLITKKSTDDNTSKNDDDIFRGTGVITNINGNKSGNILRLSAFFGREVMGVKILPMNTESENFREVKASKVTIRNESSAETDTMDLDSWKEMNSHSGGQSTKTTKMKNMKSNLPPMTGLISSSEVKSQQRNRLIPDINLKLHALPSIANSQDNMCASSSRTQSLDMGKITISPDQPKPMSSFSPNNNNNNNSKADPGSRWVKRLKVSSSNAYVEVRKSSDLSENPCNENTTRSFLAKILKCPITSSEQTTPTEHHHGEEPILPDRIEGSLKKDKDLTVEVDNKDNQILLSHPWIRRWLRNNNNNNNDNNGSDINQKKESETAQVLREPHSLKVATDEDIEKEQFPSIAAMALMGKAMNGFQSCELVKRGSFSTWNTKAF